MSGGQHVCPGDTRRVDNVYCDTGTDVNLQLLVAIKSLQDQVADLQAKLRKWLLPRTQQSAVSQKKVPKELLVTNYRLDTETEGST